MVMPPYSTDEGILQGGTTACPGTTAAFEKMVVPVHIHRAAQAPADDIGKKSCLPCDSTPCLYAHPGGEGAASKQGIAKSI